MTRSRWIGNSLLSLALFAVLPVWRAGMGVGSRAIYHRTEHFCYFMRSNPLVLVFPLAAVVPYCLPFSQELVDRYFTYTRVREEGRTRLARSMRQCALVTGLTFFGVAMYSFVITWLAPASYEMDQASVPEAEYTTFSELNAISPWLYALVYSLFFASQAAAFGVMALCGVVIHQNRIVGLTLPWVAWTVWAFAMAHMDLLPYSPDTVMPFSFNQLSWWQPMLPYVVILSATLLLIIITLKYVHRWGTLQ